MVCGGGGRADRSLGAFLGNMIIQKRPQCDTALRAHRIQRLHHAAHDSHDTPLDAYIVGGDVDGCHGDVGGL